MIIHCIRLYFLFRCSEFVALWLRSFSPHFSYYRWHWQFNQTSFFQVRTILLRLFLSASPFLFWIFFLAAAPTFLPPLLPFPPAGVPRLRVFCLFMRAPSFRVDSPGHQREQTKQSLLQKKRERSAETGMRTVNPWRCIIAVRKQHVSPLLHSAPLPKDS